jgi:hypothetical protein
MTRNYCTYKVVGPFHDNDLAVVRVDVIAVNVQASSLCGYCHGVRIASAKDNSRGEQMAQ